MAEKTYRIGDAARLLDLKPYVLRFWETEFPQLRPLRTRTGQRLYAGEHIELLRTIQHLLHERGLTIDGARKEIEQMKPTATGDPLIHEIVRELEEIRNLLAGRGES